MITVGKPILVDCLANYRFEFSKSRIQNVHQRLCLIYLVNIQCWWGQVFGTIVLQVVVHIGNVLYMFIICQLVTNVYICWPLWKYFPYTVYPKKYAHGFCFAVLCYGYTLTDFPISIRLTSLALCQSNDCPNASKATLMNMDKYFMWMHYERLHNHNKAKHNKTVCIFLGIYCMCSLAMALVARPTGCRDAMLTV